MADLKFLGALSGASKGARSALELIFNKQQEDEKRAEQEQKEMSNLQMQYFMMLMNQYKSDPQAIEGIKDLLDKSTINPKHKEFLESVIKLPSQKTPIQQMEEVVGQYKAGQENAATTLETAKTDEQKKILSKAQAIEQIRLLQLHYGVDKEDVDDWMKSVGLMEGKYAKITSKDIEHMNDLLDRVRTQTDRDWLIDRLAVIYGEENVKDLSMGPKKYKPTTEKEKDLRIHYKEQITIRKNELKDLLKTNMDVREYLMAVHGKNLGMLNVTEDNWLDRILGDYESLDSKQRTRINQLRSIPEVKRAENLVGEINDYINNYKGYLSETISKHGGKSPQPPKNDVQDKFKSLLNRLNQISK